MSTTKSHTTPQTIDRQAHLLRVPLVAKASSYRTNNETTHPRTEIRLGRASAYPRHVPLLCQSLQRPDYLVPAQTPQPQSASYQAHSRLEAAARHPPCQLPEP